MSIKLSGRKTYVYKAERGTKVSGDGIAGLSPNAWYEIAAVASSGSTLPLSDVNKVFKTPDTGETAITPATGDDVWPLTLTRIAKTDAEVSFEEGSIEVTDDTSGGYVENLLDGYKNITGSFNGFLLFDEETQELEDVTDSILNRFINKVVDDGAGTYTETEADNDKILVFILTNKDAAVSDIQNYIITPIVFTGISSGAGLKDGQKRDLSWQKAQGPATLYKRTVFSDDVVS